MSPSPTRAELRALLERNRPWAAYALADLDPAWYPNTEWAVSGSAVRLIYSGLEPPVLFLDGPPEQARELARSLSPGRYQFTLLATHRSLFEDRFQSEFELQMWRMVLKPQEFPVALDLTPTRRLSAGDEALIADLMADHADRPDSFHIDQVRAGVFYGCQTEAGLLSMAGTHVVSEEMSVAAIGNVFTSPEQRGRGLGLSVSHAVTNELLERGIETIVLNVAMSNAAALTLYRKLGFMPFCGYYEGVAWIGSKDG